MIGIFEGKLWAMDEIAQACRKVRGKKPSIVTMRRWVRKIPKVLIPSLCWGF